MTLASWNLGTAGERNHRAAVPAETLPKCPLCRRLEMPWRSRTPTPGWVGAFLTRGPEGRCWDFLQTRESRECSRAFPFLPMKRVKPEKNPLAVGGVRASEACEEPFPTRAQTLRRPANVGVRVRN